MISAVSQMDNEPVSVAFLLLRIATGHTGIFQKPQVVKNFFQIAALPKAARSLRFLTAALALGGKVMALKSGSVNPACANQKDQYADHCFFDFPHFSQLLCFFNFSLWRKKRNMAGK